MEQSLRRHIWQSCEWMWSFPDVIQHLHADQINQPLIEVEEEGWRWCCYLSGRRGSPRRRRGSRSLGSWGSAWCSRAQARSGERSSRCWRWCHCWTVDSRDSRRTPQTEAHCRQAPPLLPPLPSLPPLLHHHHHHHHHQSPRRQRPNYHRTKLDFL